MLHAKFQEHRTSGSGEYIYGCGTDLGQLTMTI